MEYLNSNSQERELHQLQQMQHKAKESCMESFRLLHSHLKALSINDLKRPRSKGGYEWAFASLFDQDVQTFTGTMLLNLDQLEQQLDKEEFQEIGSMDAFRTQESKVVSSKAVDVDLVVMESSGTESGKQDTSSSSGNYLTHVVDANLRPVNDQVPLAETKDHNDSLIAQVNSKTVENADLKAQIQEQVFTNAALKNELRKLKGNSENTKFAKSSILGKPVLQPLRNQSVVRQPTAFRSERPKFSKPRFASQVDVKNDLPKPVTPYYLPKVRESVFIKPHHVITSGSSRNSSNESYGLNDIAHKYYLEKPTGRIFKFAGLRWIPTGKMFTDSTTKVDSEPPNSSNDDITNPYECDQTLNISAGTLNLSESTSFNPIKEILRV
ncbi:hypothetical protein Tco_0937343 [Tanacetum coccineum]|uniref:Uncharacterized protein n=1 Tax=Tanacetum coccineum TaxID=301880 RepID=A0ABQ5DEY9_9ASTR